MRLTCHFYRAGRSLACAAAVFCVLTALPISAQAQHAPAGPYTLRYKFAPAQANGYAMSADIDTSGANAAIVHLTMMYAQTVQSVQADTGAAVMLANIATTAATLNEQPLPQADVDKMSQPPMTLTLSPLGQTLSLVSTADGTPVSGFRSTFGTTVYLPGNPVSIGDSWATSVPVPDLNIVLACRMTLKSVTVEKGRTVALIDTTFSSSPATGQQPQPSSTTQIDGDTLTDFDIDSGAIADSHGTMSSSLPPSQGRAAVRLHMTMQMTLQP